MNLTPAMQQFYDLKEQNPDCVLFFRMWDFYEMFDDDAHIAHKVLGINITTRNKNAEKPQPLAWIPYHAKEKYLPTLVNAGYKVAIAEQVSDPSLKWIVKREVVRVVTPSTLYLEWEVYDEKTSSNNSLIWITYNKWFYNLAVIDLMDNNFSCWEFNTLQDLETYIYKISPKEIVLEKELFDNIQIKEILEKKLSLNMYFFKSAKNSRKSLLDFFWIKNLESFWIEKKDNLIKVCSFILEYLELNQKTKLDFIKRISLISPWNFMELWEQTIRSLELIYNFSTKSGTIWTLFWVLNKTNTSMGNRLLKQSILNPLLDEKQIKQRQDFIEAFIVDQILFNKVSEKLRLVSDIDAILNRLSLARTNPKDLLNLKRSLESVIDIYELIEKSENKILLNILK